MAFVSFSVDPRLMPLLKAKSRLAAEREISHLRQEFVSPVVRGVLTYELRRSTVRSQQELTEQNEAFQDIEADVVSRINDRLWEVWENWQEGNWVGRNIFDICGYSGAAARNACTDYLRMKYPGRHKLDTALRAALEAKEVPLVRWHVELRLDWKEWRVGLLSWRDNNLAPVSLEGESLLRSELQSALVDKPQSEWLGIIAGILNFPVRYVELLDFLAVLGDVEAPYLRAAYQRIELELAPFHQLNLQPETEATRHGVLQQLWRGMLHLSQIQRAIVLLHDDAFEVLLEVVQRDIAPLPIAAEALGVESESLRSLLGGRPLSDAQLAERFDLEKDQPRRIRQDAHRRLARHFGKNNLWG